MESPNKKDLLQKTIMSVLIFSVIFSSSFFTLPKKAMAIGGVGDAVFVIGGSGTLPEYLSSLFDKITSFSTLGTYNKDYILNPLANAIGKTILRRMTGSIINWINTGFQGQPSFLTDPESFFRNIAKEQTNIFIIKLIGEQTNNPYALDLAYSILNPSKNGFTLYDDMARNCRSRGGGNTCPPDLSTPYAREAYARQFIYGNIWGPGGWNNWYSLTQYDKNNIYGAYLQAQNELAQRKAQATGYTQQDLAQSGGFLSFRKCVHEVSYGLAGTADAEDNPNINAGDTLKQCDKWETQTPGKAAADLLGAAITSPGRQAELADEFYKSLNLIVEAFVNQVLTMGVRSLSDSVAGVVSGGGGSGFSGSFTSQLTSGSGPSYKETTAPGVKNPKTIALESVADSIKNETDYKNAKGAVLAVVTGAENRVSEIQACYARIIKFDQKYKTDPVIISGQNFASTTLSNTIYPKKNPLTSGIASSTLLIDQLNGIKQNIASTTDPSALSSIYQNFLTLKGTVTSSGNINQTFHDAADVATVNLVELPDMETFFTPIITDEITPALDACTAKEQEVKNPSASGI